MKFLVIGSGGREHAICKTLRKSKKIDKIFCAPGNAGTSEIAINIDLNLADFEGLKNFVIKNLIDIIIVGPEKPLVDGIVDFFQKNNIKIFGPNKIAAQLEGSKIFTKKLCKEFKIPTANFGTFNSASEAINFIDSCEYPLVIKADGLAAGKGVYICENKDQSYQAVKEIFDGKFGLAKQILIEEFLTGEEMSFFIISDGNNYKVFGTAQDHKRVYEGDKGKNTGGMGAYSPSRLENSSLNKKILQKIINPTLLGLKKLKTNFTGFLYAGLMIKDNEPYLIEYNVRMGDPECQTILPKLKTDFAEIIIACVNKNLNSQDIEWHDDKTICIVLCANGYPDEFKKDVEIKDLDKLNLTSNQFIFHAGTKIKNSKVFSNGGRVLNFVVKSKSFFSCRSEAQSLIDKLNWQDGFNRKDIGFRVIDK